MGTGQNALQGEKCPVPISPWRIVMAERFTRVFNLKSKMVFEEKVAVAAGSLLRDNANGKMLVQLKFKNMAPVVLKSVKIVAVGLLEDGSADGERVSFEYKELNLSPEEEGGQKIPVYLKGKEATALAVKIVDAEFEEEDLLELPDELEMPEAPSEVSKEREIAPAKAVPVREAAPSTVSEAPTKKKLPIVPIVIAVALLAVIAGVGSQLGKKSDSKVEAPSSAAQSAGDAKEQGNYSTSEIIDFTLDYGNVKYVGFEKASKELTDQDNVYLAIFDFTNYAADPARLTTHFWMESYQNGAQLHTDGLSYSMNDKEQYELVSNQYNASALPNGTFRFAVMVPVKDESPVTLLVKENGGTSGKYQTMEVSLDGKALSESAAGASSDTPKVEKTSDYTPEEMLALIEGQIGEKLASSNAKFWTENGDIYISMYVDGMADCVNKANNGDAEARSLWKDITGSGVALSQAMLDVFKTCHYDGKAIVQGLNDMNTEKCLYYVENGKLVYDALQ